MRGGCLRTHGLESGKSHRHTWRDRDKAWNPLRPFTRDVDRYNTIALAMYIKLVSSIGKNLV